MQDILKPYKPANYLRLPLVSRKNCIQVEDILNKKLYSYIDDKEYYEGVPQEVVDKFERCYDEIPKTFINLDDYPSDTNLLCWYCDRTFNTRPIFISPSLKEIEQYNCKIQFEFEVYGNFCSFNCAEAYINFSFVGDKKDKYKTRLNILYEIFTGKRATIIEPAIPKTLMKKYGGQLTDDEYSEKMQKINPESINHRKQILQERYRHKESS